MRTVRKPQPTWHAAFLAMLPAIVSHARIAFRHLHAEAREEAVQEVVANACRAYVRLVELGKSSIAYPVVLARYGVGQVNDGRIVGGHMNVLDILSHRCQRHKGVVVERLDKFDREEDAWQEVLVEDRRCGPFDIVRTKLDFGAWLRSLPRRQRRIAQTLATGETLAATGRRFGVCESRVWQFRQELAESWRQFMGDEPAAQGPALALA